MTAKMERGFEELLLPSPNLRGTNAEDHRGLQKTLKKKVTLSTDSHALEEELS